MKSRLGMLIGPIAAAMVAAAPGGPGSPPVATEQAPPPYLRLPRDGRGPMPLLLSETGAFADVRTLAPAQGLLPYEVNVPFWSDGSSKIRWAAIPRGEAGPVRFNAEGAWRFPPGTVFVKHFDAADGGRPGATRRLETRLLVCSEAGGVHGVTYEWRPDQSDAERVDRGHQRSTGEGPTSAVYYVPGPDDCRRCHAPEAGGVLGVNTRQLNGPGPVGLENQLVAWGRLGLLDRPVLEDQLGLLPSLPRADRPGLAPEDAARAYLDANCAFCHRPGGAVADFDARWEVPLAWQGLIGVPARINLGIDRARLVAPNDPWRSMLVARLGTLEPTKMPPLAHERVDRRGVEIFRAWIASMPGPPVLDPPAIEPAGGDFPGPVRVAIAHGDPSAEVRYTTDGSPPGPSSTRYDGPLRLDSSTTVRARAFRPGHTRSITVQETFVIDDAPTRRGRHAPTPHRRHRPAIRDHRRPVRPGRAPRRRPLLGLRQQRAIRRRHGL